MASACVNNIADNFPSPAATAAYPSFGWLSPRISFSRDDESSKNIISMKSPPAVADPAVDSQDPEKGCGGDGTGGFDFEFRLDDPVAMLTADELFSDGKLMPLHFSANLKHLSPAVEVRSPETAKSGPDPYLFSPKAPRCSSRWREILGLKKLYQNASKAEHQQQQNKSKLIKHLLHRRGLSSSSSPSPSPYSGDASFNLPLLKDCDSESVSVSSSRLSLYSSSSGNEHELYDDLPRLSLDSDKPSTAATTAAMTNFSLNQNSSPNPFVLNRNPPQPRIRMVRAKPGSSESGNNSGSGGGRASRSSMKREAHSRGVSVDSPRMNSSGKIVFQSLERSSSSPSTFNGGRRLKHRGMERSYSANVRVTPVLNVPVCSLRGSSKSGSVFGSVNCFLLLRHRREKLKPVEVNNSLAKTDPIEPNFNKNIKI